jgi:hypothetical protein
MAKRKSRSKATRAGWFDRLLARYNEFRQTKFGKVVNTFVVAFIGTFVIAEAQVFNALSDIVSGKASFSVLLSLLGSLAVSAVIAAIRATEVYLFQPKAEKAARRVARARAK